MSAKRRGRPPLPEGEARTMMIRSRLRPHEVEAMTRAAERRGLTLSQALAEAAVEWTHRQEVDDDCG